MGRHPESYDFYMYSVLLTKISKQRETTTPQDPVASVGASNIKTGTKSVLSSKTGLTGLIYMPGTTIVNAWTESIVCSILGAFHLLLVKIKSWIQKKRANYFNARSPTSLALFSLALFFTESLYLRFHSELGAHLPSVTNNNNNNDGYSESLREKGEQKNMEGKSEKEEENENGPSCDNDTNHPPRTIT